MVQKIPPPPPIANMDPAFNRWLIELTNILNATGQIQATAITQPPGTNNDDIATCAFVLANTAASPSNVNPLQDGVASPGVAATFSRGDHVHPSDTTRAPLASPTFTGVPAAPTAAPLTSTAQLATTAYADAAVGVETTRAEAAEALLAPLASPALTGNPTAPTQALSDNTTKLATTAFVQGVAAGGGSNPIVKAAAYFNISNTGVVTLVSAVNVSSVVRNSVGAYTVNFTAAFADINYFVAGAADRQGIANAWLECDTNASGTGQGKATGSCNIGFFSGAGRTDPGGATVLFIK